MAVVRDEPFALMKPADILLLGSLAATVALAVAPQWSVRLGGRAGRLLFALAVSAALVAGHWESLVRNQPWSNPDEAQMLAEAITLREAPLFWRDVDGTTHGPLDTWPLTLASWLGMPLDFRGARAFSLACTAVTLLVLARHLSSTGETAGRIAILPATAWLAAMRDPEFHQLCSEHVSLALIAAAVAIGFGSGPAPLARWRAVAFGALLGALPLAKLQSGPLAALLGLCWLLRMVREPRAIVGAMAGGLAALIAVLAPTFLAGAGGEFWTSYIIANRNYALHASGEPPWPRQIWGLTWWLLISGLLPVAAGLVDGRALLRHPAFLAGSALSAAALFAIFLPGTPIFHYWLLLVPGLVLLAGAATGIGLPRLTPGIAATAAVFLVLPFAAKAVLGKFQRWDDQLTHPPAVSAATNEAIQRTSPAGSVIAIWGWEPELYVLNRRRQATPEAHTFAQIQPGPLQAHFRARFLAALERNPPAVFVDAVHPGAFSFNDRTRHGHEIFPELQAWIVAGYELDGDYDGRRVYRRR